MGNNLKYIVYLTINKTNNKIYIGIHETEDPKVFDGYIGFGANLNIPNTYNKGKCHLHNSILKYGTSAFYRITLKVFDNLEDALMLQSILVTDEFIKRTDTFNQITDRTGIENKVVYQFNLEGNLIKTWDYVNDRMLMSILNKTSFDNSYWSDSPSINVSEYKLSSNESICQYNKDGVLLNTFDSISKAALKLDIAKDAVTKAVYNRKLCAGYYFLREEENVDLIIKEKSPKLLVQKTPVYRYTKTGEFDKSYSSIKDATKDTPKTSLGGIIRAIKSNRAFGGYKWSYEKSKVLKNPNLIKPVKVAQYDLDHNLIKIWNTVTECKKEFPACQKVCKKQRPSTKGYIFEYIN